LSVNPLDALVWYLAFVIAVTCHEAAHALVAFLGGDRTAYHGGQVSLNPVPHMRREPFGMILVPLVTVFMAGWPMGWASTPYDPTWEQRYPRRAGWMAAAGPGANLLLALLAVAVLRAGLEVGAFFPPETVRSSSFVGAHTQLVANVGRFLSMLLTVNAVLFLFNLIPVPPLDGAAIIGLFLPEDTALRLRAALSSGPVAMFGLLIAWMLFSRIGGPLFSTLIALVHGSGRYG
jgi:Zn-dependent protease